MAARPSGAAQLHFYNMKVDLLAPDAAMLIGQYRLERGPRVTEGVNTRLFRKIRGRWLITHEPRFGLRPAGSDRASSAIRSAFQNFAQVWVPWPCVSALSGISRKRAVGIRFSACCGHVEIARVDEIVGRIDPRHRRLDRLQLRPRIVVPRRIELVDQVVGVQLLDAGRDPLLGISAGRWRASDIAPGSKAARAPATNSRFSRGPQARSAARVDNCRRSTPGPPRSR